MFSESCIITNRNSAQGVKGMGKTLKQMILDSIDQSQRGCAEELAKISGSYSSGSNLKKVLLSPSKEFDSLIGLIKIVRHLFGEDEKKLMEKYSTEIDPNNKTARYMLEYLSVNRLLDPMKQLIEKMLDCKNKDSREWAKVYSLQHEWQTDFYGIDFNIIIFRLNEFKTSIHELNTLISIMRCNSYYSIRMYRMSFELSRHIQYSIENIKDEFIKASFSVKYNEIMSYLSLKVYNEPERTRKHAQIVINHDIGQTFNAFAHYAIGCSYLFTDYEKAKGHLYQSYKIYIDINRKDAADNVNEERELLEIVWDKDIFSVHTNKAYRYYWMARNNRLELEVLEGININEPFYFLIKGMKGNNTEMLLHSLILFVKEGDLFLANLSKFELLNRGYSENIVNELLNIYIS
jgi:hypothetical protein